MGLRRKGIMLILGVPVAGIHECRVGAMSSKGCHGNGHALMKGRGTGDVGGGYQGRGVQRGPYYSGGPRVGPNYGNRGGSGGALRGGVPSVVSGRRGTAVVPGAVGGIPWGCWSWLCCDWSHGGTGLRDAWEARAELCGVAESRPWYRAGDSK